MRWPASNSSLRVISMSGVPLQTVFETCATMPIAVDSRARQDPRQRIGGPRFPRQRRPESLDHALHVARLRRQAQAGDAELAEGGQFVDQRIDPGRQRQKTKERKEGLTLSGGQRQPVGMVKAAELAVVLGKVVVARGEA